ncbi:acyl-CoA carboxylase epsilon subunit [Streptomyces sp. NPDC020681]|uniref:acyl-CoA carboxylase epsilon subunit n=1 Tax=Streptomyces sp. NPDC020681 TaxID=3365083 RepID=UPI0037919070
MSFPKPDPLVIKRGQATSEEVAALTMALLVRAATSKEARWHLRPTSAPWARGAQAEAFRLRPIRSPTGEG